MAKRFTLSEKAYALLRTKVYQRDGFVCRRCKGTPGQAHHIVWRSAQGSDTSQNLCVLCPSCHDMVHGLIKGKHLVITAPGNPSDIPNADIGLKFTLYKTAQRRNKYGKQD